MFLGCEFMIKKIDNFFEITKRGSNVKTEIIAGLTTFFAMAYIVIANPNQLVGFNRDGDLNKIWLATYVASILVAVIGSLLMALYAKMPLAQACGMGLNSFFFSSFILPELTSGNVINGYKEGLCIILISGLVFLIMSVTGLRQYVATALPENLKKAIPAGIGLFIALLGFKGAGIVESNQYTLVQLFDFHGAVAGKSFFEAWCAIAPVVLSFFGLCAMAYLSKKKVTGAVIYTILGVSALYYVTTLTVPDFNFSDIGASFKAFSEIGFLGAFKGFTVFSGGTSAVVNAIVLIITFCLVDMFDTVGTLYAAAAQSNMVDENGDPLNMAKCMNSDSIATAAGAILGTSTATTLSESAAGVAAGGRTGLTSFVTSLGFVLCLFLTPLASIVPACATAPALIYVGVLMAKGFANVEMDDITKAVPAFLAFILMPLTYSISNGIAVGAVAHVIIAVLSGKYTKKDVPVTVIGILFILRFFLVTV